ncbi:MAG: hypothetical protein ACRDPY_25065 [Streptosporangiaceae bacterium]
MLRGSLAAADFAELVLRRLDVGAMLPVAAEVLLERAVSCADVYAPVSGRGALRERIAGSVLAAAGGPGALGGQGAVGGPPPRMAAAAFAASAQSDEQLSLLRPG